MCATRAVSFAKLWKKANDSPTEFTLWTGLLDLVEKQQNLEHARKAFDGFFKHFPYCYGYWKKWADMEKHKGNKEQSLKVYEAGVKAVPLSIDLWTAFLEAAMEFYHGQDNYATKMRSLYEEAILTAGLEFRSDALWEHYISWETGHNRLVNVTEIYTRLLKTPTQLYFQNWDSFNKLVEDNRPDEMLSTSEFAQLHAQVSMNVAAQKPDIADDMEPPIVGLAKPLVELTDETRIAIRELMIASREKLYQSTYAEIMKRWYLEEKIRRPYFHVKPLEEVQLTNWAEYLSFEEAEMAAICASAKEKLIAEHPVEKGEEIDVESALADLEDVKLAKRRVRVLYERCLIPCALYEHLWIRYARHMELTERNISGAREVWRRACTVHLRYKPTIHWHWGCFEDRYPSSVDQPPMYPEYTCLQILTELEARLTDSALVCCRRADAMRREKKPLFDIIACLRGGINRLRFLSGEQTKLAQSLSGPTASRNVAQAIATAAQARSGAGVLAGRLSRLLRWDALVSEQGVPKWMLLLNTVEEEQPDEEFEHVEEEEVDSTGGETKPEGAEEVTEKDQAPVEIEPSGDVESEDMDKDSDTEAKENGDQKDVKATESEPENHAASSFAESMDEGESGEEDGDDDPSASPPVLPMTNGTKRKAKEEISHQRNAPKRSKLAVELPEATDDMDDKEDEEEDENEDDLDTSDDEAAGKKTLDETEEIQAREAERLRREKELAAEEEERIRLILNKRNRLVYLHAPEPETLTDEDREVLHVEDAAVKVLREAIDYDPRNERLYAQLLDIIYQRRPVDIDAFIEVANLASVDSVLPATIKLAFCQRKLQFLEEFDTDMCRLHATYEEYLGLCDAVNKGVSTAATARGASRFTTAGYPLPDLLNLPSASARMTSVVVNATGVGDTLVSAGPVARQQCLTTDQSVLDAAASVGTPAPEPSTSAGYFTAGAYEPLAAALGHTEGLPPPAPTNLPMMMMTDAQAAWAASADQYAYYYGTAPAAGAIPTSTA